MALPAEPRQKMINLMYLVLTALLALNVSAEILNAFKTVNNSLMNSNGIIEEKNQAIFSSFDQKLKDPKSAVLAAIWKPKADEAKKHADDMYAFIETVKTELMKEAGQTTPGGHYKEDDLDASTRLIVDGKRGKELLAKLTDYKEKLFAIDPAIRKEFEKTLPIDLSVPKSNNQASNKDWAYAYFHMAPTVASITMLSKFENDVKNSESLVVDFCHRKVGEVVVVYDAFQAFAGTNSQYLMPGQELVITAGVGAFSKSAKPSVSVDGAGVGLNAEGIAEYKTKVGGPGSYTKIVNITYVKPDGSTASIPKKVEYTVGSPTGASVSADAVKVLYIGLDNPLTVSGGSVGAEKVQVGIDNGSIKSAGAAGKYIANVTTPGKATVNVTIEGKAVAFDFRVKTVPPPTPKIGRAAGGRMSLNDFKSQQGVRADLENFVFDGVKYDVTGFTMICTGKGFEASGPQVADNVGAYFTADSKRIMEMCKAGSTIILDRIRVSGPSGALTLPQTVAFNLTN